MYLRNCICMYLRELYLYVFEGIAFVCSSDVLHSSWKARVEMVIIGYFCCALLVLHLCVLRRREL